MQWLSSEVLCCVAAAAAGGLVCSQIIGQDPAEQLQMT